jgi:hypothetical protein
MTLLKLTCKEAAAILVAREDRRLGLTERLGLRLHLAMCQACPKFERQILTMRTSMRQWRNYAESGDADPGSTPQNKIR